MKKMIIALFTIMSLAGSGVYPETCIVTEVNRNNDLVTAETSTGFTYQFAGCEDYEKGDLVSCIMHDNHTEDITDDVIVAHLDIWEPHGASYNLGENPVMALDLILDEYKVSEDGSYPESYKTREGGTYIIEGIEYVLSSKYPDACEWKLTFNGVEKKFKSFYGAREKALLFILSQYQVPEEDEDEDE